MNDDILHTIKPWLTIYFFKTQKAYNSQLIIDKNCLIDHSISSLSYAINQSKLWCEFIAKLIEIWCFTYLYLYNMYLWVHPWNTLCLIIVLGIVILKTKASFHNN